MFLGDSDKVERIERRVIEALSMERASTTDAITALCNILILSWAQIACESCRKLAADRLREAVPAMLAEAGCIADETHGLPAGEQPQHLHH
jgi:hypothetical protein